ncbi:MAG: hypothetical protein Ta2A_00770 [Treponemataceae bacterium]|nr:MAG: hypothetical protein Ta2A_00770 [Treponemataceae bacterium]
MTAPVKLHHVAEMRLPLPPLPVFDAFPVTHPKPLAAPQPVAEFAQQTRGDTDVASNSKFEKFSVYYLVWVEKYLSSYWKVWTKQRIQYWIIGTVRTRSTA